MRDCLRGSNTYMLGEGSSSERLASEGMSWIAEVLGHGQPHLLNMREGCGIICRMSHYNSHTVTLIVNPAGHLLSTGGYVMQL